MNHGSSGSIGAQFSVQREHKDGQATPSTTTKIKEELPMQKQDSIQINITISKEDHDLRVKLAAERNLNDPDSGSTKGGIGREIISGCLEKVREERRQNV
jgi:hypothetical protein